MTARTQFTPQEDRHKASGTGLWPVCRRLKQTPRQHSPTPPWPIQNRCHVAALRKNLLLASQKFPSEGNEVCLQSETLGGGTPRVGFVFNLAKWISEVPMATLGLPQPHTTGQEFLTQAQGYALGGPKSPKTAQMYVWEWLCASSWGESSQLS